MAEISIIVPVYNVEKYIERCIESILNQSYSEFDLILIDDGSKDSSSKICDEYEKKDSRISVIHQKNEGPSSARNNGIEWALEKSDSKYLMFVDSDDCIHPQYIENLYEAILRGNVQVSMCQHEYIKDKVLDDFTLFSDFQFRILDAEELLIETDASFNYAWGKLFLKDLFKNLRYPKDIIFGEDNLIIYKALFEANKIAYIPRKLYYYFYNATGITKSNWDTKSLAVFKGIEEQLEYYKKYNYKKAFLKEMELYIQQYAYQIHRIRDDEKNAKKNRVHLEKLKYQMKNILKEQSEYNVKDNFYWYEALYPRRAKLLNIIVRLKFNIQENGCVATLKKVVNKIKLFK